MMRVLALCLFLSASNAFAFPVTLTFTGEVNTLFLRTGVFLTESELATSSDVIGRDPNTPVMYDGVTVANGNSAVVGTVTFDSAVTHAGGFAGPWPSDFNLQWQVATEGIVFNKAPGLINGFSSFDNDGNEVYIATESVPNATSTSPFSKWTYMNFDFNFNDGAFTDGSFYFESEGAVHGSLSGTISNAVVVGVPDPASFGLFFTGLSMLVLFRRRQSY